jgi:hypothetical protein
MRVEHRGLSANRKVLFPTRKSIIDRSPAACGGGAEKRKKEK